MYKRQDKGHDALGKAHGDVHGHLVDLIGDAHGRYGIRPITRSEVVEHCHAGHVQQVLDSGRDTDGEHAQDDGLAQGEHLGTDAHISALAAAVEQHKEITASRTVGKESGQAVSYTHLDVYKRQAAGTVHIFAAGRPV